MCVFACKIMSYGRKIKEDEMGLACSTLVYYDLYVQNLLRKLMEKATWNN